jgi:hypothetical protein
MDVTEMCEEAEWIQLVTKDWVQLRGFVNT